MAKQKSLLVQHAGQLETVFTYLSDGWRKRGINIVELVDRAAQPESQSALDEIVGVGGKLMSGEEKFALKHLTLVEPRIPIVTPRFSKAAFFGSKMGVCISMGIQFRNWVLSEISNEVPASENLILASFDLSKLMDDVEVRGEIGVDNLLTPDQWAQTLYFNLTRQPNGEEGYFKADNFFSNLSYLRLRSGEIVASRAERLLGASVWHLRAFCPDVDPRSAGDYVFSAAPTS